MFKNFIPKFEIDKSSITTKHYSMKKLFLLGLVFAAGVNAADAQVTAKKLPANAQETATHVRETLAPTPSSVKQSTNPRAKTNGAFTSWGQQIGSTFYDIQHATQSSRVFAGANGVSAVWNEACQSASVVASYANLGPGYNHLRNGVWTEGADGTCDQGAAAAYGIASKRVFHPQVVILPNGEEWVFTYDATNGVNITKRTTAGGPISTWAATADLAFSKGFTSAVDPSGATKTIVGPGPHRGIYPKVVLSGNYIHMVYTLYNAAPTTADLATIDGTQYPFLYSRYNLTTNTWDKQNVHLPGLSLANGHEYVGFEAYTIAANGANVAVTSGNFAQTWSMWKSTDNGNTWNRTTVRSNKYTMSDTLWIFRGGTDPDTSVSGFDNSFALQVDGTGKVHTWAGQLAIAVNGNLVAGNTYYPLASDGILYWNESMPDSNGTEVIAWSQEIYNGGPNDYFGNGSAGGSLAPYGTKSVTSFLSSSIDNSNNLYLAFSGLVEGTSSNNLSTGESFRDIYIMKSTDGGLTWTYPRNIAGATSYTSDSLGTDIEEEVYPAINSRIGADGIIHLTYQLDYEPGNLGSRNENNNDQPDAETDNGIMYFGLRAVDFSPVGVKKDHLAYINQVQAFPNPTTGATKININLIKEANVTIKVTNMLGQEVTNVKAGNLNAGSHLIDVDLSSQAAGVYMYTISSDNFSVTNRIVKQ